jgi:class I fructose-bisphosphate aldolase
MRVTNIVKKVLGYYGGENPGVKAKICQVLMHGKLAGSGKMVILPVDQGFEHGPDRSFAKNSDAYDPDYHFELAIDAGLSAYAAPLGFLQAGSDKFAGQIPTILKLNSSNSLLSKTTYPDQAFTGSVKDALELGCAGVGLTIYPGSHKSLDMIEEAKEIVKEARMNGLMAVIWSYPRGGDLTKDGETAIDVCAYAAHIAALLGAHIIKVKPPTDHIENPEAKKVYQTENIKIDTMKDRIAHVVQSCFAGKRLVVFSGGAAKSVTDILDEAQAINAGGGHGSIIGRNSFQRPKADALNLLKSICEIYR